MDLRPFSSMGLEGYRSGSTISRLVSLRMRVKMVRKMNETTATKL
jgi:hypothetical protein